MASLAIFAVTRSPFALIFAFLGPVVAVASFADAAIRGRRLTRAGRVRFAADATIARARIDAWHDLARAKLKAVDPDIHSLLLRRDRDTRRWAHVGPDAVCVSVGRGRVRSDLDLGQNISTRLSEETSADRILAELAESARWIEGAPILLDVSTGVTICGASATIQAMARAIVIRTARLLSPADVEIRATAAEGWQWLDSLPHRRIEGPRSAEEVMTIEFVSAASDARDGRERVFARIVLAPDVTLSPRSGALIIAAKGSGVSLEIGSDHVVIAPEYCTSTEASDYALALARQASREGLLLDRETLAGRVEFASLDNAPHTGESTRTLACSLGVDANGPWVVDLVTDGPHVVIGGTTGSGKSELLVSWVLALAGRYPPNEVSVLLVDFKGGAAFAQISHLPHSVGVISDLDASSARRAIESLAAEIRHRERVLLEAGARSFDDLVPGVFLARLVVFVDEFATLARDFPDLREIFVDLAARGRSLGVHLVLCTQRPADVMRDAILANVSLRVSLRVTDRPSSVALLGTAIASTLGRTDVGRAAVALAGSEPRLVQMAIADRADIDRVAALWPGSPVARRPWCAPLPSIVHPAHPLVSSVANSFAVVDLPSEQRQFAADWRPERDGNVLVHGARRSGRSAAIEALRRSQQGAVVYDIGEDVESAFDLLVGVAARLDGAAELVHPAADGSGGRLELVIIDNLDHLIARVGPDHESAITDVLGRLMRHGPACGLFVVIGVHRVAPSISGIVALCDERLLLRMASRQDHVLAHGRGDEHDDRMPPGGGWWKGQRVQVVLYPQRNLGGDEHRAVRPEVALGQIPATVLAVISPSATAIGVGLRSTHRVVDLREPGGARTALELIPRAGVEGECSLAIVGDVDAWHVSAATLVAARSVGPVVVHGCSVAEFRAVTRVRRHPPPLGSATTRAWVLTTDGEVSRCSL